MAPPRIQIIVDAATQRAQQALGALSKSFEQVGKSSNALQGSWTELRSQIDLITGAARTAGQVVVQAFEFAELGAQINQTSASFENLLEVIGASPDLLNQLQDAAGGTVSDLELMQSTLTLLAGTSGEFATDLANATPELLEIARAANKLNPALGSVTDQYNSLALGIKRSSPLILDNLGLTIKIGDANDAMAAKLGKSVEELTAMEKQQALLNEVLRAGDTLITQAGGAADNATDDYSRLRVAIENAKNSMAAMVALGAADIVPDITQSVQDLSDYTDALNEVNKAIEAGVITQHDFEEAGRASSGIIDRIKFGLDTWRIAAADGRITVDELTQSIDTGAQSMDEAGEVLQWLSERQREHLIATGSVADALDHYNATLGPATEGMVGLGQATREAAEQAAESASNFDLLDNALQGLKLSADQAFAAQIALGIATGALSSSDVEQMLALEGLQRAVEDGTLSIQDFVNIVADGVITGDEFAGAIRETTSELDILAEKQGAVSQKIQDTTQSETEAIPVIDAHAESIGRLGGQAGSAAGQIGAINSGLAGLPSSKTIDVFINVHGQVPNIGGGGGGRDFIQDKGSGPARGQAGLDMIIPPGFPNDSFMIGVQSGERVQVTPNAAGRDGSGGQNVTIDLRGAYLSGEQVIMGAIQKALRQAGIRQDAVRRAR